VNGADCARKIRGENLVARIDTLVVARDRLFGEDLAQIIAKHFAVVGTASLDLARGEIECGLRPRLLIIEAAALEFGALRRIRSEVPAVKTVVLMESGQAMPFAAPAQCDIDGCIPRDMSPETLKLSLGLILAGQAVMPSRPACTRYCGPTPSMRRHERRFLTPRECDVLRLLSLGRMTKEIARELGVSAATVKVDLKVLLGKLKVRNRTEAAVWAFGQLAGSVGPSRQRGEVRRDN
jgi:two-component system, NarL family, nitrate/nitrite response regulator NarL